MLKLSILSARKFGKSIYTWKKLLKFKMSHYCQLVTEVEISQLILREDVATRRCYDVLLHLHSHVLSYSYLSVFFFSNKQYFSERRNLSFTL